MKVFKVCFIALFLVTLFFATEVKKASLEPLPKLRGDEPIQSGPPIPYLGGRSPGDSIGITTYDAQSWGSFGQRLALDDNGNIHVDWMWCGGAYPGPRYCAWNFRFTDNTWYGETQASTSVSGYVQLDIVRDANPDNQVSAIAYHYDPGAGYFSWVDTDAGQGWGLWPNNPVTPAVAGRLWPKFAWTENGNIVLATGDYSADWHHLYVCTDSGWNHVASFDSCATLSHFVRTSRNSNKVVFVHTQYITDTSAAGQIDNDVYYLLSTDGGVTWGPHTNITNYRPYPLDSVRAYNDVDAIFDRNDNLHVAWAGRRVTTDYWEASKIFHWDAVNDTITIVNTPSIYYNDPGGWWIATTTSPSPGSYHMPADCPQLIADSITGWLYCLWGGNDDYNDGSAAGYFNGELYGAKSTDGGITWTDYTNLTNTRTPGAPSGACDDEDYMTANPFIANDSIYLTYVEDKDAGAMPNSEGVWTINPVRCWVFHKDMIPGVEERGSLEAKHSTPMLEVCPNPFKEKTDIRCMIHDTGYTIQDFSLKIFDAAGQLIKDFSRSTIDAGRPTLITWQGDEPPGVYFVHLETENNRAVEKVVLLR